MLKRLRDSLAVERPRAVGAISTAHGLNEFFSIVVPPIIPFLVSDLGITYAAAGLLLTVFFGMYSIFQLPAGLLADRLGKVPMMLVGLAGMAVAFLLASAAPDYRVLVLAQALAGISGSTFHPTGLSIISDVEGPDTEGRAMGVFGFGGAVGTMASPLLVGGLAAAVGWRPALAAAAAGGLLVTAGLLVLFRRMQDEADERAEEEVDAAGSGGGTGDRAPDGGSRLDPDGGVGSMTDRDPDTSCEDSSTAAQTSRIGPSNMLSHLRASFAFPVTPGFFVLALATVLVSLQTRALQTYTTSFVAAEIGGSATIGNLTFFVFLGGGGIASLWGGSLADRFERGGVGALLALATGLAVGATAVGVGILADLPSGLLLVILLVWFFVIGALMYACVPVKNAIISDHAEREYSGGLFGVIQTASSIGSAAGPAIFGAVATRWGIGLAYPAIAVVSLLLTGLFLLLVDRT